MKENGARTAGIIVVIALSAAVGAASIAGVWWVPVPAMLIAVIALLAIKSRRTDIVSDERDAVVASRAARIAYAIYGPAAAVAGATLIAIPETRLIGYTLTYSVCALLLIYVGATLWLQRQAL